MLSNATSTAWIDQQERKGRQAEDAAAQTANVTVGVGIMIAHNPLQGSGQAGFPHPALALGEDADAMQGIGMTDRRRRQPASDEAPHAIPKHAAFVAAPRQRAMPEPPYLEPKNPRPSSPIRAAISTCMLGKRSMHSATYVRFSALLPTWSMMNWVLG